MNLLHDISYGKFKKYESKTKKLLILFFVVSVAENVLNVLPNHHSEINAMKEEGYKIIGYYRKSVAETGNRVGCLQRMVNVLYNRPLVDKVFVSPCSSIKQHLTKRDLSNNNQISSQLNNIHGNIVDFLHSLKNNNKICVVAIDYAGLTTSMTDLKNLLR